MNHIDAIEGAVYSILQRIHQGYLDGARDDSDFIRNVKLIIDGVKEFIAAHPELMIQPDIVQEVLYDYARQLWLGGPTDGRPSQNPGDPENPDEFEPTAYRRYYFDHLYQHGAYPR